MYYIAYFEDLKKSLVTPKQWIRDIKQHKEKFYNNSLNRSQTFYAFYTNNPNAFSDDGLPKNEFPPNFAANLRTDLNGDGLFKIKLKHCSGNTISKRVT